MAHLQELRFTIKTAAIAGSKSDADNLSWFRARAGGWS